jgi:hypothetical protein
MLDRNAVTANLYEFLKENETGIYREKERLVAYVHIDFYDLKEFVGIIGDAHFDEGGIDAKMFNNTICIDINDIIEGEGQYLSAYAKCFDDYLWNEHKEEIREMEA